jgi:hypothetical protein
VVRRTGDAKARPASLLAPATSLPSSVDATQRRGSAEGASTGLTVPPAGSSLGRRASLNDASERPDPPSPERRRNIFV